jgi:L-threonylcarbamoyladenylate synthase
MEKYTIHRDHDTPTLGDTMKLIASICADKLKQPDAVLLVPTETVYGLVCRFDAPLAVERIYELKGRSENKPLALFVSNLDHLQKHGITPPPAAYALAENFCPGPLTIIFNGPDGKTIGVRIPDYPLVLEILDLTGCPLASTSANRSGQPNALTLDDAVADLTGQPDIAVDGGSLPDNAMASTVLILSDEKWKILREGPITHDMIAAVLDK